MSDSSQDQSHHLSIIDSNSIRKRPAMYVGSTDFFGFINYLVCPVALLLGQRATRIAIAVQEGGFVVEANIAIPIEAMPDGQLIPFEGITHLGHGHGYEGTVVNALSESLAVEIRHNGQIGEFTFCRGVRQSAHTTTSDSQESASTLRFAPDTSIFTTTNISKAVFKSYLRRLSYLHRGVRFSITIGGESHEYYADCGIFDLFMSVSAPYQLLHEPICIEAHQGALRLEAVLAYQSWKDNDVWCFINNGRAVEGGTHEAGLRDALKRLHGLLKLSKSYRNGVVGIMSIHYPDVVWEGCIKSKIGSPELRKMVRELVVNGAVEWVQARPDLAQQLQQIETFQFPDAWYT